MKNKIHKSRGWKRNWSGRGIAMLNRIEKYSSSTTFTSKRVLTNETIKAKLGELLGKYPNRNFYQSLHRQAQKFPLSQKQIELIELDYQKYFIKY